MASSYLVTVFVTLLITAFCAHLEPLVRFNVPSWHPGCALSCRQVPLWCSTDRRWCRRGVKANPGPAQPTKPSSSWIVATASGCSAARRPSACMATSTAASPATSFSPPPCPGPVREEAAWGSRRNETKCLQLTHHDILLTIRITANVLFPRPTDRKPSAPDLWAPENIQFSTLTLCHTTAVLAKTVRFFGGGGA